MLNYTKVVDNAICDLCHISFNKDQLENVSSYILMLNIETNDKRRIELCTKCQETVANFIIEESKKSKEPITLPTSNEFNEKQVEDNNVLTVEKPDNIKVRDILKSFKSGDTFTITDVRKLTGWSYDTAKDVLKHLISTNKIFKLNKNTVAQYVKH